MKDTQAYAGRMDDDARLAPHLDAQWRDEFVLELRMLDIPGEVVGDALVVADSHVAESGRSAQEVFGDAKEYARATAASTSRRVDSSPDTWTIVGTVAGILGTVGAIGSVSAWLGDSAVTVTLGALAGLVLLLALAGAFLAWSDQALRFILDRPVLAVVGFATLPIAAAVGLGVLFQQPLFEMSAPILLGVSVVLLAVNVSSSLVGGADEDRIVAPGESAPPTATVRLGSALLIPGVVAVICAVLWLMD
ncbi:MAG: hypothetical protein Q4G67_02705 [Actinomycetia bacterium]|nr:hypothetical protein [Actinomycetes bacterium]